MMTLEIKKDVFLIFQHIILGLKFLIAYAIPDIPETIETNRAKLEFLRREALKVHVPVNLF